MIPSVPQVLVNLAELVVRQAAPDLLASDRQTALGMSAALMGLAAQSWDSAAHHLVQENRALAALLDQGSAFLDARPAENPQDDLRLSVLQAINGQLRAQLIDLHIAVEGSELPEARALDAAIWRELVLSTERRLTAGSPV